MLERGPTHHLRWCDGAWIALALALLFCAMHFQILALDFTTLPPPSISYSVLGPPDQPAIHPEHASRLLAGYYTADPTGTAPLQPFDSFALASITKGHIPFWNPFTLTGYPYPPEYQSPVFYPPKLLMALLPEGYRDLYSAIHIFMTGFIIGVLAWMFTNSRIAAVFAGATVYGAGFVLLYFPTDSLTAVLPWGSLLLLAIETLCRHPSSWKGAAATTLAVAGLGVAGHPEVAIYLSLGGLLFLGLRLLSGAGGWRAIPLFTAAAVCGVLLALPNLFGFLSNIITGEETAGVPAHPNYYGALQFLQFLFPYAAGPINGVTPSLLPRYGAVIPGFMWGPPLVLFAAMAGLYRIGEQRMRAVLALAGSATIMTLLGLGLLPLDWLFHGGFLNRLNMNYIWVYPALTLSVLAGIGLQNLATLPPRKLLGRVLVPFIIVAVLSAGFYYHQLAGGQPPPPTKAMIKTLAGGLAPGILWAVLAPIIIVAAAWASRDRPNTRILVVAALLMLGLGLSVVGYYPSANRMGQLVVPLAAVLLFCVTTPVFAWALVRSRSRAFSLAAGVAVLALIAGASAATSLSYPGLPCRYRVTRIPAFVSLLKALGPNWRSYGLYGAIGTDNLIRFDVSVLNNLNALLPTHLWSFFQHYVDPSQKPAQFGVNFQTEDRAMATLVTNHRLWDYLSVRYVLVPAAAALGPRDDRPPPGAAPAKIPREGSAEPLRVELPCKGGAFSAVLVKLSTYGRTNPGQIRASLSDPDGQPLAEASLNAPSLLDNALHVFSFSRTVCDNGLGEVVLDLQHAGADPGEAVAAWRLAGGSLLAIPVRKSQPSPAGLIAAAFDSVTGMMVFENPTAQPRTYLAERTQSTGGADAAMARFAEQGDLRRIAFTEPDVPDCPGASGSMQQGEEQGTALVTTLSANDVTISANARHAGPLVLVDTYDKGWTATLNGVPVPLFRVNGVFRGVCLPGAGHYDVVMRYRPVHWVATIWAPALGIILFAAITGRNLSLRRRNNKPFMSGPVT